MKKQTKEQTYTQNMLTDKLELSYGVDYKSFEALKTCGLGDNSAQIGDKKIRPYLSSWFVQGEDLELLLKDPKETDYTIGNKLCNNLVLLGLNAGSMDKLTPAWHFFHLGFKKGTDELVESPSERNLKEYITTYAFPFEGAYITDILKFQDEDNNLYIEPNSPKVQPTKDLVNYNFAILKKELDILHINCPSSKILLVPLGGKCEEYVKSFIVWLPEAERKWIKVPELFAPHYAQTGWNNLKRREDRAKKMQEWCKEHIIRT